MPPWVCKELDKLWAEPGDKVAHDAWMANIYYQAHALSELGRVDWTCHGSSPTSMVYVNEATGIRTFVAWNPTAAAQSVEFFQEGKPLGTMPVPPCSISSTARLGR